MIVPALLVAAIAVPIVTQVTGLSNNPVNLRVLLVGGGSSDPTTVAWATTLQSEGVPYTEVDGAGALGSETVTLPALTSGSTGLYNGVVFSDAPADFAAGQLSTLFAYEATYAVRQVDGYAFPTPSLGLNDITTGDPSVGAGISSTTPTLTATGLSTFPSLKGPVPIDPSTFGYPATVATGLPTGASETPLLEDASGNVLIGLYQHPSAADDPSDPQSGVAEMTIGFNYNQNQLQWLILGPAVIDWVSGGTHLGLYRNYIGQDVDDVFIADNEWSSTYQCTPAATDPPDYTCPAGVANNPADSPPDVEMSAADVTAVANWEAANNFTLELAFNAVGACTAPSVGTESSANCAGSTAVNGTTYTDPGQAVDPTTTNDGAFVNALLADQGDFDWITHTWSHQFLGCEVWMPQATTSITPGAGGSLGAGTYYYVITAATAYGESEPSLPINATVGAGGSVALTWPDATNGTGTTGNAGPTLATLESEFSGGTGFWGYNVYRGTTSSGPFGLVGQVAESGSTPSYSFTDTGATAPGAAPGSSDSFPTATDPGIDCSSAAGSWDPATSTTPDSSIDQEIGLDDAFAANNGLTHFTPASVVTGEHSGLENPNMPTAFADMGITTFAADGSRQPNPYTISGTDGGLSTTAQSAPRYPSNIYYNASTWADEVNEYNTLYASTSTQIGNAGPGGAAEFGHCAGNTSSTTCITTPATEASILASESRIEMGHVLANNPRVGYAHQSDLIGPDYTLLTFLSDVLGQYNSWYTATAPYVQTTDASQAGILAEQAGWATAQPAGTASPSNQVSATQTGGTLTITNNGSGSVTVPITVPPGSTVGGSPFGAPYGGNLSAWQTLGAGASLVINIPINPVITSANAATASVRSPFSFTVLTVGLPPIALSEVGTLPGGFTFTDNGNGTATIAGTPAVGSQGTYPLTITAANGNLPNAVQNFTLTVQKAPEQYDLVGSDGGVFVFGQAGGFFGSLPGLGVHVSNIVGIVPTADQRGYFLVGSDGGVFAFGDAPFENSLPGLGVHVKNIVGIVPTADDRGYFLVGSDGGVFAFGDAGFENSLPGLGVHISNISGIALNGRGGYWLVGADGAVYALGNAAYLGGLGGSSSGIVGIASTISGNGYWLVGKNGSVYSYGDAPFYSSLPALGVAVSNVVSLVPTPDQLGYWMVGSDGGIFAFGDALEIGSLPGLGIHVNNIVGAVPTS